MKIAVFSDSHGRIEPMAEAVTREKPDVIIHLGDLESDANKLALRFPDIVMYNVCGNCDFLPLSADRILVSIENVAIFACHGHKYGVKTGLDKVINTAMASGADVLLFGHTHRAVYAEISGFTVINPGSVGEAGSPYGVLYLENGKVRYEAKKLENI